MEHVIIFNEEDVKRILALINWGAVKMTPNKEEEKLDILHENGGNAGEAFIFDEHSKKLQTLINAKGVCTVLVYDPETKEMRQVQVNTVDGVLDLRQLVE